MRIGFAAVAGANPAPILLWAAPEARTGERLRLNGFCGINVAGYRLTREGRRYRWLYHDPADDGVVELLGQALGIPPPAIAPIDDAPDPESVSGPARDAAADVVSRFDRPAAAVMAAQLGLPVLDL